MYAPQGLLSGLYDEYRTRCSITMSLQTYAIEQSGRHERSTGVQLPVCCPRSDMHFNLGMQGVLSIESRTTYSSACLLFQLREIDAANLESRLQPTNRTDIDNTVDRVSSPSILFPSPTLNGRSAERRRNLSTTFPL